MRRILAVGFILLASGCSYINPLVEEFNIVSPAQESQIGTQVAAQVSKDMKVISGTADAATVQRIGAKLLAGLPSKDFDYHFYVVEDSSPNAFTIPGGTIYVHTGTIKLVHDESELAGVIAHEIGHAYERHPAKSISRQYGVDYLNKLLFKGNSSQLKQISLQLAQQSLLLHYGRDEEFQADEVGYQLLSRTGYRTDGLVRFFRTLQTLEGKGATLPFLSTHPPTPERIARLEAMEKNKGLVTAISTTSLAR